VITGTVCSLSRALIASEALSKEAS
jgi:hypothetical protein